MPAEWYDPIWIHPAFICYYMPIDFPDFERDALQAEYESLLYPCMLELMNDYADNGADRSQNKREHHQVLSFLYHHYLRMPFR